MRHVRPALPEDRSAVGDIYRAAIEHAEWLPSGHCEQIDLWDSIAGEKMFVCVEDDGKVLGFISVWTEDAFVHHLYVSEEHQGVGIGTALIESLKSWLPMPWFLKCVAANKKALNFYHGLGFESLSLHTEEIPHYVRLCKSEA